MVEAQLAREQHGHTVKLLGLTLLTGARAPLAALGRRGEAGFGSPAAGATEADPGPLGGDGGPGQGWRWRRNPGRVGVHPNEEGEEFKSSSQNHQQPLDAGREASPVIVIPLEVIIQVKGRAAGQSRATVNPTVEL